MIPYRKIVPAFAQMGAAVCFCMVAEYAVGKYVGAIDLHINSSIFACDIKCVCVVARCVDLSAPYHHPVCTNIASSMMIKITASARMLL